MRHAKSDWDADFGSDHERPLNGRGLHSARLMGRVLAGQARSPHLVISSTAVRARTTAELAIEAGDWGSDLQLDRSLYDSGPERVLETAAGAPDVGILMLVGHQPTWSMLVRDITGAKAEIKTATIAVVQLEIESWDELPDSEGSLIALLHPRQFVGSEFDRGD